MKKVKTIFALLLLAVLGLCGFAGCGEAKGAFYALEEAYELGFLTTEDLEQIAYYYNNGEDYPEALDSKTDKAIRATAARDRNAWGREPKAKAEGFTVVNYYGGYNGCYAVKLRDIYSVEFAWYVPPQTEMIGGVEFQTNMWGVLPIEIWKK